MSSVSETEKLIHKALKAEKGCRRTNDGYLLEHASGKTSLRFIRKDQTYGGFYLSSVAEIETTFNAEFFPRVDEADVGLLNARAVFGPFSLHDGVVRQRTQYSIFVEETAAEFVSFLILQAFGDQLAIGTASLQCLDDAATITSHREYLGLAREWDVQPPQEAVSEAVQRLRDHGFVATEGPGSLVFEIPLHGESAASRLIDLNAQTALVHVRSDIAHPLVGRGFNGTIAVPIDPAEETALTICRRLNELELVQDDFPPRFGAWGLRGNGRELVFGIFVPTANGNIRLESTMASWLLTRTLWIRDNHWNTVTGIQPAKVGSELC